MQSRTVFATRLRNLREMAGMNQTQLSEKIGVSRSTIGNFENDDGKPDIAVFDKIASCFGVSYDYLLGKSDVLESVSNDLEINDKIGLSDESIKILMKHKWLKEMRPHDSEEKISDGKRVLLDYLGLLDLLIRNDSFYTESSERSILQLILSFLQFYDESRKTYTLDIFGELKAYDSINSVGINELHISQNIKEKLMLDAIAQAIMDIKYNYIIPNTSLPDSSDEDEEV